jgi:CheY-like chemotaxis protein
MTRILCLDDDPQMVDVPRLILERAGYAVVGTTDDDEAWALLRAQPVDLFIQDFMRPDGSGGWGFLQRLKADAQLRHVPVLGVSAGPRDLRAAQLRRFGLDLERDLAGYLRKPYGPQELLEAVEGALRRHGKPIPRPREGARDG